MRNAATFDDDLGFETAARRSSARKGQPSRPRAAGGAGKTKKRGKRSRFDMHRVARVAAIAMAATMAIGIMVNALVLQKGHHPAPLFGKATASTSTMAVPKTTSAAPAVRTVQSEDAATPEPKAPSAKPRKTVVAAREAEASVSDDAIGRLLAGGPSPVAGKGPPDARPDGKMVTGVQRALTKLGFKVPTTGTIGPATKKAIEAFEKDRHMPVKGELNRRLVKVLAAESGTKIE